MLVDKPISSIAGVIQVPSLQFPQVNSYLRRNQITNADTTQIYEWLNKVYSKSPMWTSSKDYSFLEISAHLQLNSNRLI